jgi:single-stranded-DNA-specific exonuclease
MKANDLEGDVIISDHHEIPTTGGPKNAFAFVNPQRKDDKFPDKTICGCTVALFLMASARIQLIKMGHIKDDGKGLHSLIAYSTAATISDCVSMASETNRAIVTQGLKEINDGILPAWRTMRQFVGDESQPIKTDSIGFGLGPRINACSRTGGDGMNAVRYYLAEEDIDANRYLKYLDTDNTIRKDIEKRLVDEAMAAASELTEKGYLSLVIFNKNGHHGIHGIAASRICERFGRPVIMLSPKETSKKIIKKDEAEKLLGEKLNYIKEYYDLPGNQFITSETKGTGKSKKNIFTLETIISVSGSARSIDGLGEDHKGYLSILECLIEVNEKKNIFLGFGGHGMAAGMGLLIENVDTLREELEKSVKIRVNSDEIYPKVWTDGPLPDGKFIGLDLIDEINRLEPYGRQFDYPAFTIEATIIDKQIRGEKKDTGLFVLSVGGVEIKGIWFKFTSNPFHNKVNIGKTYEMVVEVRENFFRGKRTCQLQMLHAKNI